MFDRPLVIGLRSVVLLFLSIVYLFSSTLYLAIYHPLTDYELNVLDDFHYSETSAMIFQDESGDIGTEPSYSCDAELDDETI